LTEAEGWVCCVDECGYENSSADMECEACGESRPEAAAEEEATGPYQGYKVGVVVACEGVPKKDKLLELKVDIGAGGEPLTIVTSAPNVSEGAQNKLESMH